LVSYTFESRGFGGEVGLGLIHIMNVQTDMLKQLELPDNLVQLM